MTQIPKGRLVKGQYEPICRDSAMYFSSFFIYVFIYIFKKYMTGLSKIVGTPHDTIG